MLEKIKKMAELQSQLIEKLQADQKDEVLKLAEEAAKVYKELEAEASAAEQEQAEVQKTAERLSAVEKSVDEIRESISKYADLFVSVEDTKALKEQLETLLTGNQAVEKRVKKLEEITPNSNQQDIHKEEDSGWHFEA